MFNFFDWNQNPFMMMNMFDSEDYNTGEDSEENMEMNPMLFMQQAFMLQMYMMQMMQTMFMMPFQMMGQFMSTMNTKNPAELVERLKGTLEAFAGVSGKKESGFKLGDMSIPPAMIGKLMQLDMSPENLEKLQGVLDFVFEAMPKRRDDSEYEE